MRLRPDGQSRRGPGIVILSHLAGVVLLSGLCLSEIVNPLEIAGLYGNLVANVDSEGRTNYFGTTPTRLLELLATPHAMWALVVKRSAPGV